MSKFLTATLFLFFSLSATANFKRYQAPVDESSWQFEGNGLNCRLSHKIPLYGNAYFQKASGKNQSIDFKLSYKRNPVPTKKAEVIAVPPAWHRDQSTVELGETTTQQGQYIFSAKNMATWRLLNQLEAGKFPTFLYQEFADVTEDISVSISAVGFRKKYAEFLDCINSLATYNLNELKKITLHFDFAKESIRPVYRAKLNALAQYIKYDPSVEVVFINGHTDSKGAKSYNDKLSQRRVTSVKKALQLDGVPDKRFNTNAYGERRPKASNRSESGRAKNRRVYIQISQKG